MDGDQALGGFSSDGLSAIPAALQPVVDAGDLSGFVTLLWRKGEVAQVNTLGWRDVEAKAPMTRDTLFRIASMTKPITSVAALMLVEEGKLRLDDPITKWMPEFKDLKVLKSATGPVDETVPAERDITVDDLMTHRSGLAYAFTSIGPIARGYDQTLGSPLGGHLTTDEWLAALGTLPLSYQPGDRFHYSHATDVLGFLVGRVAGTSYRDFIVERILKPLGMNDTDFWCPPEKRDRMAKLYRINPKTDAMEDVSFPHLPGPPEFCAGGGGLISTADDYLRFARMMLNGGELDGMRYLKRETLELMRQNRLTPAQREIPFMGIPFWLGQGFGLGVSVITDPEKQAWMGAGSQGSFGWPGAFGTWWQADPVEDMVMIYLIQNSMPLEPEAAAQLATGQRMGGRAALPVFQKLTYGALGKAL
ncbi:serine hydrolase domain-containing protein [Phenylobacterium sp.]|jgi:CubicO group peptidase (beta-lactamase class C family)|uniref:serine hydrolase domain-containing protein n=1 Tax=Phenylobacterium sp. TaxID=1871053 RepID=UPI0035B3C288